MKVILVNERYGQTRTIVLKGWLKGLLSVCLLGAPVALGYLGYQLALSQDKESYSQETSQTWHQQLRDQSEFMAQVNRNATEQLETLTWVAMLQSRLLRLDARGESVTSIAQLDIGEFDFTHLDTGDIVRKDQASALVGSTGRSTGPHIQFEFYKHGRVVDPATYIHSTAR